MFVASDSPHYEPGLRIIYGVRFAHLKYIYTKFWFKYDLGRSIMYTHVRPDHGLNPYSPDHDSTFYAPEMPYHSLPLGHY